MVTVVKNPAGHKIIDQAVTAGITDSGGDAIVTFPYHGLGTGDIVYIVSTIEDYNGFQYVTVIDANTFKLSEYAGADFISFQQQLDISYYQTTDHVWSSIFLPIVYKLSNDRWPTNSVDTVRTISSFTDDNGYTNLNLSGALKSSFNALEFVEISGASDELNGVYQIVEKINTADITIDLPYAASNNLVGVSVQYYYNNYQVKVKVYGGLQPLHPWYDKKPIEEVAELSLTPDENNLVTFSVSDYIKGKVAIKNNLLIPSYPLNTDAFTGFQIATAESYDESDNYSLSTTESGFTQDDFEGYAVAGKLPFKNVYSGDYSDYVFTSGSQALWMTNFSRLFAVEGLYFDISFIKSIDGAFTVTIEKYVSDYLSATEVVSFEDQGIGVYRIPIEISSVYTSFCVYATTIAQAEIPEETNAITLPALSSWVTAGGAGVAWTTGASPTVNLPGAFPVTSESEYLTFDYAFIQGYEYEITISYTASYVSGSSNPRTATIAAMDSSNNVIFSDTAVWPTTPGGATSIQLTFTATIQTTRIGIKGSSGSNVDLTITARAGTETIPAIPAVDALLLTEDICIDILQSCVEVESGDTPEDDFFRLLETGFFRLLEDGERRLLE